tara:strand:- start:16 stop:465 length:450 start_codon:yes stop_codon:yes gene_type:complete
MTLKEFKEELVKQTNIVGDLLFEVDGGSIIPPYFHITEMGLKNKYFVDCGGTVRTESFITFQVWTAEDFNHRLAPTKLLELITKNEGLFNKPNLEVEIEYQTNTLGSYTLELDPNNKLRYILKPRQTNCLAPDKCGVENNTKQCGPSCC